MILAQISVGLADLHFHYSHRVRQWPFDYQDGNWLLISTYYIAFTSVTRNCIAGIKFSYCSAHITSPSFVKSMPPQASPLLCISFKLLLSGWHGSALLHSPHDFSIVIPVNIHPDQHTYLEWNSWALCAFSSRRVFAPGQCVTAFDSPSSWRLSLSFTQWPVPSAHFTD